MEVFYTPNLGAIPDGFYKSGDPVVVKEHVKALDYGLMDLGIISCKYLRRVSITRTHCVLSPDKLVVFYSQGGEKAMVWIVLVSRS